jgi:exodeoxyribonuclease VII small subunit
MAKAERSAADGPVATPIPLPPEVAGLSFEDALAELERIVRGLEAGQQKLEDSIGAYERGDALRRLCEAKLAEVETRVNAIVEANGAALSLRPVE